MSEGKRLFDPPTAADCVEAAAELVTVREFLMQTSGLLRTGPHAVAMLDGVAKIRNAIDLLAAVAGSRVVGVGE